MGIYTRSGDGGETELAGGQRRRKDDWQLEACGSVDELNSVIGLARAEPLPVEIDLILERVQRDLFSAGAVLAALGAAPPVAPPGDDRIAQWEAVIDHWEQRLPPLDQFILPSGSRPAALLHQARTVCRRAERRVVAALASRADEPVPAVLLRYFNRLGDLLFVLARAANQAAGAPDVRWEK